MDWLRRSLNGLPDRLREAGQYISEHEFDAATRSMREIASSAGLPPAAFTRLAQAVGWEGWEEFRNDLIESTRPPRPGRRPFSTRLEGREAGTSSGDERSRLPARIVAVDSDAVRGVDVERIAAAADVLHAAPRIWLSGYRSCRAVAHLLNYHLRLFRENVHVVGGVGLEDLDFGEFRRGDAVVAVTFAPYSRISIATARHARRAGCSFISITDRAEPPMAEPGDFCLLFDADSTPAFFPSLTAAVSIAQALAAAVFKLGGQQSSARLRKTEARLAALGAYAVDAPKPANS